MKLDKLNELSGTTPNQEPAPTGDSNLNDAKVQEMILNPEPQSISIGGKEVIVHQLSAKMARRFSGFVSMLMTEAVGGKTDVGPTVLMTNRALGLLNLRFEDDFLPILAAATGKPGAVDDQRARALATHYSEIISASEVQRAFLALYAQNTPVRVQKKSEPAPTQTRRRRRTT